MWGWGGSWCEWYYTVRNTIGRRPRRIFPKGGTVVKKNPELVCIRYRSTWAWGGCRCECYNAVRNTTGHRARRGCPVMGLAEAATCPGGVWRLALIHISHNLDLRVSADQNYFTRSKCKNILFENYLWRGRDVTFFMILKYQSTIVMHWIHA